MRQPWMWALLYAPAIGFGCAPESPVSAVVFPVPDDTATREVVGDCGDASGTPGGMSAIAARIHGGAEHRSPRLAIKVWDREACSGAHFLTRIVNANTGESRYIEPQRSPGVVELETGDFDMYVTSGQAECSIRLRLGTGENATVAAVMWRERRLHCPGNMSRRQCRRLAAQDCAAFQEDPDPGQEAGKERSQTRVEVNARCALPSEQGVE
jgi:hypothetical protein